MSAFTTGTRGFVVASSVNASLVLGNGIGDVNGDGFDDIAVGAQVWRGGQSVDTVFVIYGTNDAYTDDLDPTKLIDTAQGFAVFDSASHTLQVAAPAGDVNGDGVADFLVGGDGDRVYIIYGQTAARTTPVDTNTDAGVWTIHGTGVSKVGVALDGGKDFNGDGIPDILIGGYRERVVPVNGRHSTEGVVWMIPGPFAVPKK